MPACATRRRTLSASANIAALCSAVRPVWASTPSRSTPNLNSGLLVAPAGAAMRAPGRAHPAVGASNGAPPLLLASAGYTQGLQR